ncbi:MAG TPA: amino acid adenylation domain-containing protein, partial [Solirubrobacterales bacterium]|nr:amino acid adenylation domain-containing protein [Solirubrobacterales bacterium]
MAGLEIAVLPPEEGTAKFDLHLNLSELPSKLVGLLEYASDLFERTTARRLCEHLRHLLASAVAEPGRPVAELSLLSAAEEQQIRREWNDTAFKESAAACLHEHFTAQAARCPGAVALSFEGGRWTYGELDRRSSGLARRLAELGVGPGMLVGLCAERSPELVMGLLAILRAGGAYLPLDPGYPRERLAFMLDDAGVPVLLVQKSLAERIPARGARLVALDDFLGEEEEGGSLPAPAVGGGDLAYVIYTSGSTGRPKGVAVTHANAARLFTVTREAFGFGPEDVWTLFHSIAFDFSVWELWGALAHGGRLVVVPYGVSRSAEAFYELLRRERVTVLSQTPSAFGQLLWAERSAIGRGEEAVSNLRLVVFGGEALELRSLAPWFDQHDDDHPLLVNMYGITETTVHVTWRRLGRGDLSRSASVVGRALPDLTLRLMDREGRPVPIGVPGEIHVGGAGVALGYLGRPELTAERFVPDPLAGAPGERLYRSGDLARWGADGDLEYLGRIDRQVKLRGFRIELGEIEASLAACPGVVQAAVVVRERGASDRSLLACVVAGDPAPSAAALRGELSRRLPSYMVPGAFAFLPALPLTPNGKVDRKALLGLEPESVAGEEGARTPQTPIEELVAGIFSEVLGVERVGLETGFFDLGGHSLSAMRLVVQVREALGVELPVRAVFESPSVSGLAAAVERALGAGGGRTLPPIEPAPRDRPLPLSFAQQRLWFLDRLEPGSAAYNIAAGVRIGGRLAPEVLAAALSEVVRRHEPLRTRFVEVGGEPAQAIDPPAPVPLPVVDLGGLSTETRELESRRLTRAESLRPFDLEAGPPLRAGLLWQGEGEHRLLLTVHHAVADGWSMEVLLRELGTLYAAFARGEESPLPALPIQYADYAVWQRRWLTEEALAGDLAYWRERLSGASGALDLPTDFPRPPIQSFRGGRVPVALDGPLVAGLRGLARRCGATLFMALLGGFQSLLSRYAGQDDVRVGTPVAGRTGRETEELIGFFVNTLVLRLDLGGKPGFEQVLRRVREGALGAYAHQELPFERLVEALSPERSLAVAPLFQAMLALQRAPAALSWAAAGLELAALEPAEGTAKLDLQLALTEHAGGLTGALEYASDLFERTTVLRLGEHLRRLLGAAVAEP